MRIAVYHNLPSGGGKRALYEMTRRLAAHHEITVYTLSTAEHDFCDLRPHCARHIVFPFRPLPLARHPFGRLNQGIRSADLLRLRTLQRQIAARIDAADHDVVFAHNCQYGQSPSLLRFLQTPSAYYCAEPPRDIYEPPIDRPYGRYSRVQRLGNRIDPLPGLYRRTLAALDRKNVHATSLVLTNSDYSRESLYRAYGIFSKVCYLGVDTECFKPLPFEREDFILTVGQLVPRKGFDFLIRSLAQLAPEHRPSLSIVSNFFVSPEKTYLEQLAHDLHVAVYFRTMVTDAELVQLYNQARLTVYAPIMEPFGFAPLESMGCATPVIGVREAGVRETVLHEVTGLLVERDEAIFAEAIRRLLDDPSLCRAYGQQGRAYVEQRWRWERTVEDLERHFRVAGEARPRE